MDTSERAVVKREPQRRRRSVAEKRKIVEEALEPGASVARAARAHGVNANQVFHWRRQYRQGLLGPGNAETVRFESGEHERWEALLGPGNAGMVRLLPVHVSEAER